MNHEEALREQIAATHDDPLAFVTLAYPWGVPGGPLADKDGPDVWQVELLEEIREHIVSGSPLSFRSAKASGHGVGKSAFTAWIVHWFASTRPHCAGVVTAKTQAKL